MRLASRWGQRAEDIAETYAGIQGRPFEDVLQDVQDIFDDYNVPEDGPARAEWGRRFQQEELIELLGAESNQLMDIIEEVADNDQNFPVGYADDMPMGFSDLIEPNTDDIEDFIRRRIEEGATPSDIADELEQVMPNTRRYLEDAIREVTDGPPQQGEVVYRGTRRDTPVDVATESLDLDPQQARSRARGLVENPQAEDVISSPRVERYRQITEANLEEYRIGTPQIGDAVGFIRGGQFRIGQVIRQTATGFTVRDASGKSHSRIRDFYNIQYAQDLQNSLRLEGVEFLDDPVDGLETAAETFNADPSPRNGSRTVNEAIVQMEQRYNSVSDQIMDVARQIMDEDEGSYMPVAQPQTRSTLDQFTSERRYQEQLRRVDQIRDPRYVYPERVTVHNTQRADWRRYTQQMRDALRLRDPSLLLSATTAIIEYHPRTLRQRAIDVYNRYRELYRELNSSEWIPDDILPNIDEVCD